MRRSRRSDQCSMYQRSSSMRSCQGSAARPLTCAQPVMPGATASRPRWRGVYCDDLRLHGRPRADDAHVALEHVDQVRQLVERPAPQQRADARDARVALVDRQARAHLLGAGHHRAQLQQVELHAVLADPALAVDRGPAARELDRRRREREERRREQQEQRPRARGRARASGARLTTGAPARAPRSRACRGAARPTGRPRATRSSARSSGTARGCASGG